MKKTSIYIILFLLMIVFTTIASAEEQAQPVTAAAQGAAATQVQPQDDVNNYSMSLGPGVTFRFLNKDWSGIELPLSGSYTDSITDVTNPETRQYSYGINAGIGYVFPLKKAGGLHVNLVPGIGINYTYTYGVSDQTSHSYSIAASANIKLEVEYFLSKLLSFFPGGLSIGGSFTLSGSGTYYGNSISGDPYSTLHMYPYFTHSWLFGSYLGASTSTISGLMARYYF